MARRTKCVKCQTIIYDSNPDEVCEEDEGGYYAERPEAHGRPRVPGVLNLCGAGARRDVVLGRPGQDHHYPARQEHQTSEQCPDWLSKIIGQYV